jgi:hypothetical protein
MQVLPRGGLPLKGYCYDLKGEPTARFAVPVSDRLLSLAPRTDGLVEVGIFASGGSRSLRPAADGDERDEDPPRPAADEDERDGERRQKPPRTEKAKPYYERIVCLRGLEPHQRTGSTTASLEALQVALMRRASVRLSMLKSTIRLSGLPLTELTSVPRGFNLADFKVEAPRMRERRVAADDDDDEEPISHPVLIEYIRVRLNPAPAVRKDARP